MKILRSCMQGVIRCFPSFRKYYPQRRQARPALSLGLLCLLALAATTAQGKVATTTSLVLTTKSGVVSGSLGSGTVVTLTATVTPATGTLAAGQVKFCDASSLSCGDIHLLGLAQLTGAGKAAIKLRPGIGSHQYKAIFLGTNTEAASSSSPSSVTVTGSFPTTTTIQQTGIPNSYSLTATLTGVANTSPAAAPTGSVSFMDTSKANAVLGTAALQSLTRSLNFFNASSPATVSEPNVTAAADFNGDGILDLAVSNSNSGATTLTILLGKGDGTFTAAASPTVGLYPDAIIAADFNGDGIADLAVTSVDQGLVTILLGKGDGTFTSTPDLYTGSTPQDVATADFNGDGIADLIVINGNTALIFLGNGDGSFTAAASSPALSGSPIKVAIGDYNNDGNADLAITNGLQNGSVQVFLGKGDGTFTAGPATPAAGNSAVGISAADFNGDGKLDLAVTQYGAAGSDAVCILLGNGDGTFQPAVFYAAYGTEFQSVAIGDLNGDGIADLVLGQHWSGAGSVLLGKGDGTFEASQSVQASAPLSSGYLALADFDGDGVPDLAVPNQDVSGSVVVLLTQNAQVQTATINNVAVSGPGTHQVVARYAGDSLYTGSTSTATALQSQVATPVLSPTPGTYTSVQTVTITDATPGATIYYQAFGPQSTNGIVAYTGPITLSNAGPTFFEVYASAAGYLTSYQITAIYTLVLPQTAPPTLSLAAGYYPGVQAVTLADSAPGAKIYYTTNGAYPTLNSTVYSGPITVSKTETLVAVALVYGDSFSVPVSAQYVIGSAPASLIYTVAGTGNIGYTGDGGAAILADLNTPSAIVKDTAGNLYISDSGNHMVRKVAAGTGVISVVAGTGTIGYTGDGGQATAAELGYPESLALDTQGNLLIADDQNYTIRKVNLSSGIISTYAGNPKATGSGEGGPATSANLSYLGEMAVDASNNVFFAEAGTSTIREINGSTGILTTIAGTGQFGYAGDSGPASAAVFRDPLGLAFDANGNLYVADTGNNIVRMLTESNGTITGASKITTVAGTPTLYPAIPQGGYSGDGGPATSAQLHTPLSVRFDASGNLYISDEFNSAVRRVTTATGIISTVVGNGENCGSSGGDGGSATSATLCIPDGIAVDKAGNLYIADSDGLRVREVLAPATPPATQAATPTFSLSSGAYPGPQTLTISDSTPGASIYVTVDGKTPATASAPGYGFTIDIAGAVTVKAIAAAPGYENSDVQSATYTLTSFSPTISTIAGNGTPGIGLTSGPALSIEFQTPQGIAIDKAGNLYISDPNNYVIWKVSAATGIASVYAGTGAGGYFGDGGAATSALFNRPNGIALDSSGNLYIADVENNAIRKVTASTGIISTFAGGRLPPQNGLGDGGPATSASLSLPDGVAVDASDNLYIADSNNFRIRKVTATTGIISTVAGNGSNTFSGDGGLATQAGVVPPYFLTLDDAGNLYFAGINEGRVRKVTASTGIITTLAGVGDIRGSSGDGGKATSAQISVQGLSTDSAGNLYIANWPAEIREVNAGTGLITRVAGIGFVGFSGDGGAAAVTEMFGPGSMAFDPAGSLVFADTYNARVRKVTFTQQSTGTPVFSVPAGTYSTAQTVSITDATPGAAISYTTDGSTPTQASTAYTGPITISATETLKAIAIAVNYTVSPVASANYVIALQAPAPSLNSLSPAFSTAGSGDFVLTINGSGFTAASTAYWGSTALTTQFVNAAQLTVQVTTSDIALAGITAITVQTPAPGGGTSNALQFEVDTAGAGTPPSFPTNSATVAAGTTATYAVTLPSSATSVSAVCLNLPAGAACTYSATAKTLTITTSTSTPKGTYTITTVFTETLPGAAAALVLLPLVLLPMARGARRKTARIWLAAGTGLVLFAALAVGCGGGSGGSNTPPPQTHQVTSSATVILIVN